MAPSKTTRGSPEATKFMALGLTGFSSESSPIKEGMISLTETPWEVEDPLTDDAFCIAVTGCCG